MEHFSYSASTKPRPARNRCYAFAKKGEVARPNGDYGFSKRRWSDAAGQPFKFTNHQNIVLP
jgi:hypothetical protein